MLFGECPLPGETRADDVFPAHPNGIQLAKDRFLLLYATRGLRGTDDDLSIVGQIRRDAYDGPIIRDIMLAKSVNDWDPLGDGSRLVRQHGHPVAFGVPRGAIVGGKPAGNANVFVIKWRVCARQVDPHTGIMSSPAESRPMLAQFSQMVQWMQVRLSDAGDDLEIIQPAGQLRQVGFETGAAFCGKPIASMNQSFVQAVPFSDDAMQWADVCHFHWPGHGSCIAAMKYRFHQASGRYQWTEIGPLIRQDGQESSLGEASLARYGDSSIISARRNGAKGIVWMRTDDLFGDVPAIIEPAEPTSNSPLCAYVCPDGKLRLLTGDPTISPYRNGRDPLYLFEIDPDRLFAVVARHTVFDCVHANVGIPLSQVPRVEMGKLLPHAGGSRQMLVHRVRSKATKDPKKTGCAISQPEMDASGLYYVHVEYDQPYPGVWRFE